MKIYSRGVIHSVIYKWTYKKKCWMSSSDKMISLTRRSKNNYFGANAQRQTQTSFVFFLCLLSQVVGMTHILPLDQESSDLSQVY